MSVLIEAITVVVRNDSVDCCVPGGISALTKNSPNVTFRTDGRLAAVGFMTPADVEVYILKLEKTGLRFVEHAKCRDIVVIDQIRGRTLPCDWIELGTEPDGTKFVWMRGTPPGEMVAYRSWKRGNNWTVRTDIDIDQLAVDPETGLRFYVDENGAKQYLRETFGEGHPEARMLRARPHLIREAKRAVWDSLLKRGWLGIAVPASRDPDFHIAMRYQNQLGLFFIAADWGSTALTEFDHDRRDRLLARAKELHSVAILAQCSLFAPIHMRSSAKQPEEKPGAHGVTLFLSEGDLRVEEPSVELLAFEVVETGAPLEETRFDTGTRIEISDWELLDFAIQCVRSQLEKEGYRVRGWTSEPGADAHIVAHKDHVNTRILVGAARYPALEPIFDRDRLMAVAEQVLIEGDQLATASVSLAHADEAFSRDQVLSLYRGEPAIVTFRGLEIIEPTRVFTDRTIKIFVSSTFTEFAAEREAIARTVLPELQRRASSRGVHVAAIDLRWGVTRAELAAGTAVQRCLHEVDVARPFFVGMIGEHHGTRIPNSEKLLGDELDWLKPEAAKASITELEIRYAMLRPNYFNPSALLYYRASESTLDQGAVPTIAQEFQPLLSELRRQGYEPHPIDSQFAGHLTDKLWKIVSRHYPGVSGPDAVQNDFRKHRQYGLQSAMALPFAGQLLRERSQGNRIACTSSWEAAALAGALSIQSRKTSPALTFEHFPALADDDAWQAFNARLSEFCRRTTMRVTPAHGAEASFEPAAELGKLQAWAASARRRLLIVIGGTDYFGPEEEALLAGVNPSANIDVILTRSDARGAKARFEEACWSKRDLETFVDAYLARHRKALDKEDVAALLAHPLANNLSYLRFVCDWLVAFARFETISYALQECLQVEKFSGFSELLNVKGRAEMSDADWFRIAKTILGPAHGGAEADLTSRAGVSIANLYSGLSILSPMLESGQAGYGVTVVAIGMHWQTRC